MLLLTTLLALVPACFAGTAGSIGTMLLLTMLLALIPACFDGTADSMAQCCCWHSSQLLHPFIYCGASSWSFVLEMALEKQNPRCKANPGTPGTKNLSDCVKPDAKSELPSLGYVFLGPTRIGNTCLFPAAWPPRRWNKIWIDMAPCARLVWDSQKNRKSITVSFHW